MSPGKPAGRGSLDVIVPADANYLKEARTVYDPPASAPCIAPGSLSATLALIVIGVGMTLTAERWKLGRPIR